MLSGTNVYPVKGYSNCHNTAHVHVNGVSRGYILCKQFTGINWIIFPMRLDKIMLAVSLSGAALSQHVSSLGQSDCTLPSTHEVNVINETVPNVRVKIRYLS